MISRNLYIDGEFVWAREEDGVNALLHIGQGADVIVPDRIDGLPVVAIGRNIIWRNVDGFRYDRFAIPSTVRSMNLFPGGPTVKRLYAGCELQWQIGRHLAPDTLVYGTTTNRFYHKIVPSSEWKGNAILVPPGSNPYAVFSGRR